MWIYGHTDYSGEPYLDVVLGEESDFPSAVAGLVKYVRDQQDDTVWDAYATLMDSILIIHDDPGIMGDPDIWEDMTFYDSYDNEWYVLNVA
jgi:hypothetical protein